MYWIFWLSFYLDLAISASIINQRLKTEIHIQAKVIPEDPIFRSNYRYDNNERNTSAAYDLWDQAGYSLFEWPGNITKLDSQFPLLKWGKRRSKYLQSPCEGERGLELAIYSHKYLHLTWGSNRLTASYCHPLRVDRRSLPAEEQGDNTFEITVVDFAFVFDALLVVTQKGYIIRVGDIELTYQKHQSLPTKTLSYTLSKGLTEAVNRIIGPHCCSRTVNSCPNGDTVIAYKEASSSFKVFISTDGGHNFKELRVSISKSSSILHSVLFYQNWKRLYILHGTKSTVYIDEFSSINGTLCPLKRENQIHIQVKGSLQTSTIGMELSFLIWDNCSVWYGSTDTNGLVLTRGIFYVHNSIRLDVHEVNKTDSVPHVIRHTHCHLGPESALSIGEEGKIGLLDRNNVFLYGVDLKSKDFPLVALSTDISLLLPEKKWTILPCFDRNNRPKLLYPPRYLRLSPKGLMDENYRKRLAMRVVKKTLFPSDFMSPFFQENLKHRLPGQYRSLVFSRCMTSSLSVDGSVTQKAKTMSINFGFPITTTITFYAYSSKAKELHFEPSDLLYFLKIDLNLVSSVPVGDDRYWVKYDVRISLKSNYLELFEDGNIFLINLFTVKSLRCVHQPQFPIWIKIDLSHKMKHVSRREGKEKGVRRPGTLLSPDTIPVKEIQHCPLQREFDRQTTRLCSQFDSR